MIEPPPARCASRLILFLALAAVAACGGDNSPPSAAIKLPDGTFARIQRDIIDPACASCHTSGNSNARQSQLVLTADSSYQQLIGASSAHQIAHADGLMRVKPFRADSSLLFHKLAWVPGHHSRDYGQLMPMGSTQGLTVGQLEYVRRWIEAGAPRTGHVVDTSVLLDARIQAATFSALAAPAAGSWRGRSRSSGGRSSRKAALPTGRTQVWGSAWWRQRCGTGRVGSRGGSCRPRTRTPCRGR